MEGRSSRGDHAVRSSRPRGGSYEARDEKEVRGQRPLLRTKGRRGRSHLRVLILTSRTGGGHDARAAAFRDWAERLYGADVEVRIDHTLERSSVFGAGGVAVYNLIQRKAPWSHHGYYNVGEAFGALQGEDVRLGRRYYDALLREYQPDVIMSVHSMLNRGYLARARRILEKPVFCATYCGEFSGGYGFSRNWVTPEVDVFFGRTQETLEAARQLGLPEHKLACLGHLLKPVFYEPRMSATQRAEYLRDAVGLKPGRFTLLLGTGGAAAQNHRIVLNELLPVAERLQVIAVCGHSQSCCEGLGEWRERHPELPLAVLPYTFEMHRLMQVASAVVTRPGTTTCAEALQLGCPVLFNRIGGTMPQELCTLRWFEARGLAPSIRSPADVPIALQPWLDDYLEYGRYLAQFRCARTEDHPERLVRTMIDAKQPVLEPEPEEGSAARERRRFADMSHTAGRDPALHSLVPAKGPARRTLLSRLLSRRV